MKNVSRRAFRPGAFESESRLEVREAPSALVVAHVVHVAPAAARPPILPTTSTGANVGTWSGPVNPGYYGTSVGRRF